MTRREVLAGAVAAAAGCAPGAAVPGDKALISITLDLEMSRNFPHWDDQHWDYEKGNLNAETKAYTVEACRRVKARGGVVHCFVVGQVLEQENVDWLTEIARAGHPLGNHTYDHVYVLATKPEEVQFRFRRAPWLISGRTPMQVIEENIRWTTEAMKMRLGVVPAGFRTPGGFAQGLSERADVREMLKRQGFSWVSSKYPAHALEKPGARATKRDFEAIVKAQEAAQPFTYPGGLVEIPMSPISDINAFRTGRWPLEDFMMGIRAGVEWAIRNRAVFDFLAHPSCLYVTDPKFRTIDMICDMVEAAKDRATLTDLGTIARRATAAVG